jgi:hypothetical protein
MTLRAIQKRRYDPPCAVDVERDGTWVPDWLTAWRLLDDGQGWRADVQYHVQYEWALGCHVGTVLAARVRHRADLKTGSRTRGRRRIRRAFNRVSLVSAATHADRATSGRASTG